VGKGYALDHGVRYLEEAPCQVVLIVDADCRVAEGAIDTLARHAAASGRPVQALDLMLAPPNAGVKARIAGFAWLVRNWVRPLGFARLGLPCQLMGTGMAFPWRLIENAPLASGNLVEDMLLGLELAARGAAPRFCPDALVTSYFPQSTSDLASQRYRWEHGHLAVMLNAVPKALLRALRTRNLPLAALALDLMVPPLALLVLLLCMAVLGAAGLRWAGAGAAALAISTSLLAILAVALMANWWTFGRPHLSLWDLCRGVGYFLWKIPLYVRFLVRRQVRWVRSERR
jgi:cellulose synthase/poly-beta-1,6-N-acetylglucosamine synthase-like glycosyltransferase